MTDETKDLSILTQIDRKTSKLEQRIIDLIVPIQNIAECLKSTTEIKFLIDALKGPIPINDGPLRVLLRSFESQMRSFEDNIMKMDSILKESCLGEIKYIGNRLNEMEKLLHKLIEGEEVKKVKLEFSCDGYELVKKPIGYDPTGPVEDLTNDSIRNLLCSLVDRESKVIIHRFGLMGESKKTYKKIGEILGITTEMCRIVLASAIRSCRCKSRKSLVEKLPKCFLKKSITGQGY